MNFDIKTWTKKEWMYAGLGVVGLYVGYRWLKGRQEAQAADSGATGGALAPAAGGMLPTGVAYRPGAVAARPKVSTRTSAQCQSTASYVNSQNKVGNFTQALSSQCIAAGGMIAVAKKGTSQQRQVCMCARTGVAGYEYELNGVGYELDDYSDGFSGLGCPSCGMMAGLGAMQKRRPPVMRKMKGGGGRGDNMPQRPRGGRNPHTMSAGGRYGRGDGLPEPKNNSGPRPRVTSVEGGVQAALPMPPSPDMAVGAPTPPPTSTYGKLLKESGWKQGRGPQPSYRELMSRGGSTKKGSFGAALRKTQQSVSQSSMEEQAAYNAQQQAMNEQAAASADTSLQMVQAMPLDAASQDQTGMEGLMISGNMPDPVFVQG